MCGRFAIDADPQELALYFELERSPLLPPRYNVTPGTRIPVIGQTPAGRRELHFLDWGLIPAWVEKLDGQRRHHNARSETAHRKPAFAEAFHQRRCLVPAIGFYEWSGVGAKRRPYFVQRRSVQRRSEQGRSEQGRSEQANEPPRLFGMAGIWQHWDSGEGERLVSCAILTREADGVLDRLHPRMPVVFEPKDYAAWLDPRERSSRDLRVLLSEAVSGEGFEHWPVGRAVGSARAEGRQLLDRVEEEPEGSEIRGLFE